MTTSKKKVLITGANGLIGGLVLKGLGSKYEFGALNRGPVEGIDTVLHLSACTEDVYEWEGSERVNIRGINNV